MLTLKLTPQMVHVIGLALGTQPYDTVATVVAELQKQINQQQKPIVAQDGNVVIPGSRNGADHGLEGAYVE